MDLKTNFIIFHSLLIKKALEDYKKRNINYEQMICSINNHTDLIIEEML